MSKDGVDKKEVGKLFPQNTWPNLASLSPGTGHWSPGLLAVFMGGAELGVGWCALVKTMPCVAMMAYIVSIIAPTTYCIALFVGECFPKLHRFCEFCDESCFLHILVHFKILEIVQVGVSTWLYSFKSISKKTLAIPSKHKKNLGLCSKKKEILAIT